MNSYHPSADILNIQPSATTEKRQNIQHAATTEKRPIIQHIATTEKHNVAIDEGDFNIHV